MSTISPIIGAPNSFTAIDESFVTTEIIDDKNNNNNTHDSNTSMQMDKNKNTHFKDSDYSTYEKEKHEQTHVPEKSSLENQVYSPSYFQRALDVLRGRPNSSSYSAHTISTPPKPEHRNLSTSTHSENPRMESSKEFHPPSQSHMVASNQPSEMGRNEQVHSDSILEDVGRGYHHAVDSFKHALGLDHTATQPTQSTQMQSQPTQVPVVDSAAQSNLVTGEQGREESQPADGNILSTLTDKEFPLLI
jgi:hypothetical protein